jgi:hypothetical protein
MRGREHDHIDGVLSALEQDYARHRVAVDEAARTMRAIADRMNRPAGERAAAQQLTLVLRDATAAVVLALRVIDDTLPATRPRRHVSRAPVEATRPRSTELLRLTDIEVWLRRTTMDLGVQIPTTVRVGSRAASGPHIAGVEFEPGDLVAATLPEPRIGVDLAAVVDAVGSPPAPPAAESITGPRTAPHAA